MLPVYNTSAEFRSRSQLAPAALIAGTRARARIGERSELEPEFISPSLNWTRLEPRNINFNQKHAYYAYFKDVRLLIFYHNIQQEFEPEPF